MQKGYGNTLKRQEKKRYVYIALSATFIFRGVWEIAYFVRQGDLGVVYVLKYIIMKNRL